eukprot:7541645-Lingulodinium_polyedra.AAC.1
MAPGKAARLLRTARRVRGALHQRADEGPLRAELRGVQRLGGAVPAVAACGRGTARRSPGGLHRRHDGGGRLAGGRGVRLRGGEGELPRACGPGRAAAASGHTGPPWLPQGCASAVA